MANLNRSPKSSSDWSVYELLAYNITVTAQSPQEFFHRNTEPPLDDIDPLLISSAANVDNVSRDTLRYLRYLDLATRATQECMIDEFSKQTLRILGFEERGLIIFLHYDIPLMICGDYRCAAQMDVCLADHRSMILLILQQDKTIFSTTAAPPEPQVIAESIAAYQYNNERRQTAGLPILESMIIPCIIMVGTRPTFYLVPVTQELSIAVMTGQYSETPTKVVKCVTSLGPDHRFSEGMETPEYRKVAFQRFVAFKSLAKKYWQRFLT